MKSKKKYFASIFVLCLISSLVIHAQDEMISNGTFDSSTGWTLDSRWAIGSGVITYDFTGIGSMYQSDLISPIEANTEYQIKFNISVGDTADTANTVTALTASAFTTAINASSIYSAAGDTSLYNTPGKVGDIFIDTSAGKVYISVTNQRNGWRILNFIIVLAYFRRKRKWKQSQS